MLYDNRKRPAEQMDKEEATKHFSKPKMHPEKTIVTVWWCATSVIHCSFMTPGETDHHRREVLQRTERDAAKTPTSVLRLVNRKGSFLLHDNAPPQISKVTLLRLNELDYVTLPHPPYSPVLLPTGYYLFKHLGIWLRGEIFQNHGDNENDFRKVPGSQKRRSKDARTVTVLISIEKFI
ncbi:hypothetical protein RB195_013586 [Necator americanus]|uniref:Histone-lysine N-methyltransferase SETMAR n=1 Tax=Necator americanus TaxID=51031 RepID=A0ABR1DW87_NECAM